jgi:hypothetical protein
MLAQRCSSSIAVVPLLLQSPCNTAAAGDALTSAVTNAAAITRLCLFL